MDNHVEIRRNIFLKYRMYSYNTAILYWEQTWCFSDHLTERSGLFTIKYKCVTHAQWPLGHFN